MKKTLYLKFILAYVIFGIFGLVIVTTFVPGMTKEQLTREKANSLYSEAVLITENYASGLYTNDTSLEDVKTQLDMLSIYLNAVIEIINPSGRIVMSTAKPLNVDEVDMMFNMSSS